MYLKWILFESPHHKKHEYEIELNLIFSFKRYKSLELEAKNKANMRDSVRETCVLQIRVCTPAY